MRPIRLEIEGFTAFRHQTIVDFEGVETFVLSGPTGSGKSSIIDAMTFALFGSISRYNDPRLVHPIISQGLLEAKIRFDFRIGDINYTAVRIVKKHKKGDSWGATTKEARLESGDKVLAGNSTELDQQISALFGLNFDQFTSCVVLPQGEFSKFLNAPSRERQDILKNLLRLQIYEQIGTKARQKEAEATSTKRANEQQLSEYVNLEPGDKKKFASRIAKLEQLLKEAESLQKGLTHLNKELTKCETALKEKESQFGLLQKVTPPKDYTAINDKFEKAISAHDGSLNNIVEAEAQVEKIEGKLKKLKDVTVLQSVLSAYDEKSEEEGILMSLQRELAKNEKLEKQQADSVQNLTRERAVALEALKIAKEDHAAYHLSRNLTKGDKCPVCERLLIEKPQHSAPKDLNKREATLDKGEAALASAQSELQTVRIENAALYKQVTSTKKKVEQLLKNLHNAPSLVEIENGIRAFQKAKDELQEARETEREARKAAKEALSKKDLVVGELKHKWKTLDEARDSIAVMKPPAVDKDNYKSSWDNLSKWAVQKQKVLNTEISKLKIEITSVKSKIKSNFDSIEQELESEGIFVAPADNVRDVIFNNISDTNLELARLDDGLRKVKDLTLKNTDLKKTIEVSKALAQHMNASHFERWLLLETFDDLVAEASKKLKDLTSGDYSFAADDKLNFDIIDHKNADEKRTSKTLSGGETFLASLALALTLSEQISQLATEGSAPLESIFLDEGFGTLDPETLDTVATAIEELASKGRMIGLVTHMKELADRIPVQYRVHKGARTATIEKVSL